MRAFIDVDVTSDNDGAVAIVYFRCESDRGMIGDYLACVRPGGRYAGRSFAELKTMGDGTHELAVRRMRAVPQTVVNATT